MPHLILTEDPPQSEGNTEQDTKCTRNDHDNQRLPDRRVKGVQRAAGPIDASVVVTAVAYAGFPASDNLPISLAKHPKFQAI